MSNTYLQDGAAAATAAVDSLHEIKPQSLTVSSTSAFTPVPPATPVSSDKYLSIWKLMVAGTGSGVSLGIILMVSALLSRTEKCVLLRPKANFNGKSKYVCGYVGRFNTGEYLPAGYDDTYSIVTYEFSIIDGCGYVGRLNTGEYLPAGCDDTYSTITYQFSNIEEPAASDQIDTVHSN
ncbi:uncharacterized protein LOC108886523 isoform X3 [Lates calcarifer]|uniref:Uncharacterized protein LOC108886523 isoform X3 n=1 Tax=Lates calcarifer TaxID=8187 RepID=A0AAJ7V604_LATCA|nr:uncharacterized protein LOC108886523 isoform X3 [Lates calcarifer]